MVNSLDEWFRYGMGTIFLALGISLCFAPKEKLFIQLGSKRPPLGAKPIPRWVSVLISLTIAFVGAGLLTYRLILSKFPWTTPLRLACLGTVCVCLTWGLGELFAGLNACPDFLTVDPKNYRGSAFLGAFLLLLFALFAAYLAFAVSTPDENSPFRRSKIPHP